MFENIINFFKKMVKKDEVTSNSKNTAKERLHLVLLQDRANVSADFLELMKQEIIEVIKKYIDIDETAIDVRLTNKENQDGTNGAPSLYANIPIINIKDETKKIDRQLAEKQEPQNKEETIEAKEINEANEVDELEKEEKQEEIDEKEKIKEEEEKLEEIKEEVDNKKEITEKIKEIEENNIETEKKKKKLNLNKKIEKE